MLNAFEVMPPGKSNPMSEVVGPRFNDGQLSSIEISNDTVKATISHFGLECLYSWLYNEIRPHAFPIEILFGEVTELILLRSTEQAAYQRIRSSLKNTLRAGGQLIRIECINPTASVIGFRTDKDYRRSSEPSADSYINDYWLLTEFGSVQVESIYLSNLQSVFKPDHRALIRPFLTDYDNHDWKTFFPFESWLAERGF